MLTQEDQSITLTLKERFEKIDKIDGLVSKHKQEIKNVIFYQLFQSRIK